MNGEAKGRKTKRNYVYVCMTFVITMTVNLFPPKLVELSLHCPSRRSLGTSGGAVTSRFAIIFVLRCVSDEYKDFAIIGGFSFRVRNYILRIYLRTVSWKEGKSAGRALVYRLVLSSTSSYSQMAQIQE